MSWTRCCWLTTKVTTKARTSGRFWECYRGSTARQPVFLMCCHTTRTRFTKAATGIDCEGRWHSCLCKRSSGFNLTKKNDFFLLYSQIWVPSLVHAQDQLAGKWVPMGFCFLVLFAYWASLRGRQSRKCDRTPHITYDKINLYNLYIQKMLYGSIHVHHGRVWQCHTAPRLHSYF